MSPDISTVNLLSTNGGSVEPSELADTTPDGTPVETDMNVLVVVWFLDSNGDEIITRERADGSYTVSVNNEEETASVSGQLNTGGS